ncbi:MAG: 2-oxoacid:acceptor oxidoreductase family protein [Vampirovibrionales bacterium]|nr:2-oxoacid:acceptor oxidoreductase family protein [Vampirovibrionales bacterium]
MTQKHFLLEARLCAVGGQGIVLGSEILAHAAIFHEGLYAVQTPTYGSQVRGGPTKVDIIIDDKEILATRASHINFFMAIAQSSFNKFWFDVADDAVVLLDSNLVTNIRDDQRANRRFFTLPVVEMAKKEYKNVMMSNMICLGVIQEVTQIVSKDSLLKAVEAKVPAKHLGINIQAVEMGIELAKKELGAAAQVATT